MNDILKEIILGDDYLTSNIKMPAPDPFGLDAPTWEELYDARVDQIEIAVTKAMQSSDRVYTSQEALELMHAYHGLFKDLDEGKGYWIANTQEMQGNQGFDFKDVLYRHLRRQGIAD